MMDSNENHFLKRNKRPGNIVAEQPPQKYYHKKENSNILIAFTSTSDLYLHWSTVILMPLPMFERPQFLMTIN